MWKIKITYEDKSKATLTGKHKDIPYRLAVKYFMEYVNGRQCELPKLICLIKLIRWKERG